MERIIKIEARRVTIELPVDWYKHIKQECLNNDMKLKDWLAGAIADRIKKERKL